MKTIPVPCDNCDENGKIVTYWNDFPIPPTLADCPLCNGTRTRQMTKQEIIKEIDKLTEEMDELHNKIMDLQHECTVWHKYLEE